MFAILFTPLKQWLEEKGLPKVGAILLCLTCLLTIFGLFLGAVFWQGQSLTEDWPKIKKEIYQQMDQLENWTIKNIGIASQERVDQVKENLSDQKKNYQSWVKDFIGSSFDSLVKVLLSLVYMVFLMIVSNRLSNFMVMLVPEVEKNNTRAVILSSRKLVFKYFVGRAILVGIQSVLYVIGFSIFGLKYAIPIGIFAGVVTFIPYIGNLIGGSIALLMGLATGGGATVLLGIVGTMAVVQVLENYILEPWIVGGEVNLNPFATFVSVIAFSLIWGVAGTVLAVPIVAILKTVCDHIDSLRPFGYVLGLRQADAN